MDPTKFLPLEVVQKIFILLSPCKEIPMASMVSTQWWSIFKGVCRLRMNYLLSALYLRSDLRWFPAVAPFSGDTCMFNKLPTERFGSTLMLKDDELYVFGGATSELTAFNDLWVFDLKSSTWNRLTKKGERPSPRAFAKGGFVGNTLYLYGGCQTYRHSLGPGVSIDWLNDMYSYCTDTDVWSCVKLRRCCGQNPTETISAIVSYSGTFLSASSDFPASLILFGGYSRQDGICVNTTHVILPGSGRWFPLPITSENAPRPLGRYGHATCALGNNRIVILGGNLSPPRGIDSGLSSSASDQPVDSSIEGNPAKDVWLLTRSRSENADQEFCQFSWFWSKVDCATDGPYCPPFDFYHAVAVGLPIFVDPHHEEEKKSEPPLSASVMLISAATQHIRNMIASMRRKRRLLSHHRTSSSASSNSSPSTSEYSPYSSSLAKSNGVVLTPDQPEQKQPKKGTIIRQRSPTQEIFTTLRTTATNFPPPLSAKPLVAYSIHLSEHIPNETSKAGESEMKKESTLEGEWKGLPSRSELQSAPHERLGYSCVQGFGSIFLFGGIQQPHITRTTGIASVYPGNEFEDGTDSSSSSESDSTSEEGETVNLEEKVSPLHKRRFISRRKHPVLLYSLHSADFVSNLI